MEQPRIYSVTEINSAIKMLIEEGIGAISLRGEISNFRPSASGHIYFSLKDNNSTIQAALFCNTFSRVKNIVIKNGLEVICKGKISVYPPRGSYQIIIDSIELVGSGNLQIQFEALKKKLYLEGLFSPERKKSIPTFPKKIAVITSASGAAIRDVLSVLTRRHSGIEVLIIPSLVQGQDADLELIEALKKANDPRLAVEVILLTRGGGSIEDLWCFNSEPLAYAIASSKLPVVSAIGHEIDFTIADFVSDLRAPTPSAAAEILTREKEQLQQIIMELKMRLISNTRVRLRHFQMKLDVLLGKVKNPKDRIIEWKIRFDEWMERLIRTVQNNIENKRRKVEQSLVSLHALSPERVLERGYSIVYTEKGVSLKESKKAKIGESLYIKLFQGKIGAEVKNIEP